jgi:hypothetical protein
MLSAWVLTVPAASIVEAATWLVLDALGVACERDPHEDSNLLSPTAGSPAWSA